MEKFPLQGRKKNRLPGYDYSQPGWYFVTICPKDHQRWFGEIHNGKMHLNKYGEIIYQRWDWLEDQFDFLKLNIFVVMPNHVHGIIEICSRDNPGRDNPRIVPTEMHSRRQNLLSKAVNAFKTTASKMIHQSGGFGFSWQRSFYDRILEEEDDIIKVREYIENNPQNWGTDREYE